MKAAPFHSFILEVTAGRVITTSSIRTRITLSVSSMIAVSLVAWMNGI